VGRLIILRDNHRFHYFEGGSCSCRDFWWSSKTNDFWRL
jgi:hypothetical protein